MTASLYVTGTHVTWVGREFQMHGTGTGQAAGPVHAVAKPVVDGLADSACGVLVIARGDVDWRTASGAPRCEECRRVAGH